MGAEFSCLHCPALMACASLAGLGHRAQDIFGATQRQREPKHRSRLQLWLVEGMHGLGACFRVRHCKL